MHAALCAIVTFVIIAVSFSVHQVFADVAHSIEQAPCQLGLVY
jgi:hypothetical protein